MSDLKSFKLPDVGEGLTEADLVEWKVKVGDQVKINDVIVEIETAKSLVELPSPFAGVVAELLVAEGATVEVGAPIISIDTEAGAVAADTAPGGAPEVPTPPPAAVGTGAEDLIPAPRPDEPVEPGLIGGPAPGGRTSVLVGYGPRTTDAKRRPRRSATPVEASPAAAQVGVQHAFTPHATPAPQVAIEDAVAAIPAEAAPGSADAGTDLRLLAKPPVRKLAKDLGVDLASVTATGPEGRITRQDVEQAAAGSPASPGAELLSDGSGQTAGAAVASGAEQRVPVKGVRKVTAQAMVASAFTAPHVTTWVTVDATKTMRLVRQLRESRDFTDVKVSPLLVVARAVCLALRRTPELNATWDEAAQEIVLKSYVNLGIAAATPRGLLVPNIKNAERSSLGELARQLAEVTAVARAGRTQPADTSGGTFTITNVGVFGVDGGTPILNPGESGILCVGAIRKQPWVVGKRIRPRWITTLSVSFDHRVADGQQGATFLGDVASIVNDPARALLF